MEEKVNSVFANLYSINVNDKAKKKQNLTYLSWAWAWAEIKKQYPEAEFKIYHRIVHTAVTVTKHFEAKYHEETTLDAEGKSKTVRIQDEPSMDIVETREVDNEVNYFTDGNTCWVKVSITINGLECIEELPIMDLRNAPVYGGVTCTQVNKAIQRALTKAAARHGLGLYIYAGEDLPEEGDDNSKNMNKEQAFLKLRAELIDKMNSFYGTPKQEQIEQYLIANFDGVKVSECPISFYDKLLAAKEFVDKL